MYKVFECEISKKAELTLLLEADPYKEDSFARAGYKLKDGASVDQDREKVYIYIKASEDFLKAAKAKLEGLAKEAPEDVQKQVEKKIVEEEDTVAAGVSMFG